MDKKNNESSKIKSIKEIFRRINAEIGHIGEISFHEIEFTFVVPKTRDFAMIVSTDEFSEEQKHKTIKYLTDEGFVQHYELIGREYSENDMNFSNIDLQFLEDDSF